MSPEPKSDWIDAHIENSMAGIKFTGRDVPLCNTPHHTAFARHNTFWDVREVATRSNNLVPIYCGKPRILTQNPEHISRINESLASTFRGISHNLTQPIDQIRGFEITRAFDIFRGHSNNSKRIPEPISSPDKEYVSILLESLGIRQNDPSCLIPLTGIPDTPVVYATSLSSEGVYLEFSTTQDKTVIRLVIYNQPHRLRPYKINSPGMVHGDM